MAMGVLREIAADEEGADNVVGRRRAQPDRPRDINGTQAFVLRERLRDVERVRRTESDFAVGFMAWTSVQEVTTISKMPKITPRKHIGRLL